MALSQREDNFGKVFSSFFQRLNRKFVTDNPKKVLHSFRHMFTNDLKNLGVSREIIAELIGHSHGSITLDRYGKTFSPAVLSGEVQKVKFKIPVKILEATSQKIIRWLKMSG